MLHDLFFFLISAAIESSINTLAKVNNLVNYLSILNTGILIFFPKSINHLVATRTKVKLTSCII